MNKNLAFAFTTNFEAFAFYLVGNASNSQGSPRRGLNIEANGLSPSPWLHCTHLSGKV
jgi:hypothetical protein